MKRIRAFSIGLVALALIFAGPALAANLTVDLVAEKVNVTHVGLPHGRLS
jgi:hypothetical protein